MNTDPTSLDRLHDIITPPSVPSWPPAPGWYWVLGFIAAAVIVLVLRAIIHWQRNRYRREALAEWKQQEARLAIAAERASALASLAALLKRAALSAWPRREVASMHGAEWFAFLDRTGNTSRFRNGSGGLLENAAYDARRAEALDESQARELAEQVGHWLKHHKLAKTEESTPSC